MKKLPLLIGTASVGILTTAAYAAYSLVFTVTIPFANDVTVPQVAGYHNHVPADMATDPTDQDGKKAAIVGTTWVDPSIWGGTALPVDGPHNNGYGDIYVHQIGGTNSWTQSWDIYDAPGGAPANAYQRGEDAGQEVEYSDEGDLFVAGNCSVTETEFGVDYYATRVHVLKYDRPLSGNLTPYSTVYEFPHTASHGYDQVKDMIFGADDFLYVLVYQNQDLCVAKIDPSDMTQEWIRRVNYSGNDIPVQLAYGDGSIYIGGQNGPDYLVAKLNASTGAETWKYAYGVIETNLELKGIAVDANGVCYATGSTVALNKDIVTMKISSAGVEDSGWRETHDGPPVSSNDSQDIACGVVLDSGGNPIVGGYGFKPGKSSGTDSDYIALRYSKNGSFSDIFVGYNTNGIREEQAYNVMVDTADRFHVFGPVFSSGALISFGSVVWSQSGTFDSNLQIGGGTFSGITIEMLTACTSALGRNDNLNAIFMNGMARRINGADYKLCDRVGAYEP